LSEKGGVAIFERLFLLGKRPKRQIAEHREEESGQAIGGTAMWVNTSERRAFIFL